MGSLSMVQVKIIHLDCGCWVVKSSADQDISLNVFQSIWCAPKYGILLMYHTLIRIQNKIDNGLLCTVLAKMHTFLPPFIPPSSFPETPKNIDIWNLKYLNIAFLDANNWFHLAGDTFSIGCISVLTDSLLTVFCTPSDASKLISYNCSIDGGSFQPCKFSLSCHWQSPSKDIFEVIYGPWHHMTAFFVWSNRMSHPI